MIILFAVYPNISWVSHPENGPICMVDLQDTFHLHNWMIHNCRPSQEKVLQFLIISRGISQNFACGFWEAIKVPFNLYSFEIRYKRRVVGQNLFKPCISVLKIYLLINYWMNLFKIATTIITQWSTFFLPIKVTITKVWSIYLLLAYKFHCSYFNCIALYFIECY